MNNFYWQIYQSIEDEVISISKVVAFCDTNINTCSILFGSLILRCSIEIESIAKEIYQTNSGNLDIPNNKKDLYFDTDCLKRIEEIWGTNKKVLEITVANTSFTEQYRLIKPLHKSSKRGSSGSKWKIAYQNIKHDRKNSLAYSSLVNLLHALGALYILNLYYLDDTIIFDLEEYKSKVFTFYIFDLTNKKMVQQKYICTQENRVEIEKAILIKIWKDSAFIPNKENNKGMPNKIANILTTTGILEMETLEDYNGRISLSMNHLEKIHKINRNELNVEFENNNIDTN